MHNRFDINFVGTPWIPPCLTNNLQRVIAPEKAIEPLCHLRMVTKCTLSILRRRGSAKKQLWVGESV